jgi:hypothetical protein
LGRWIRRDPLGERGGVNFYAFVLNDGINKWDYLGLESEEPPCADCPSGEWSSYSIPSFSLFWGGGLTIADTTYTCKSNNKKCTATAYCYGGGAIGAVGAGIDFGVVTDTYFISDFEGYSYGFYLTAWALSETITDSSKSFGVAKSLGFGLAFITCTNSNIYCSEDGDYDPTEVPIWSEEDEERLRKSLDEFNKRYEENWKNSNGY